MRWAGSIAALAAGGLLLPASGLAGSPVDDCFGDLSSRRIEGCTELLDNPSINSADKSLAYAMRALAHSLNGDYDQALPDYDMAIDLDPLSALALNNRAWTLFKSGEARKGLSDVQRSLAIAPVSEHAFDTRAHIWQALGDPAQALLDYNRAMQIGGERIVKLYQCGLTTAGLYRGPVDGLFNADVKSALEACVQRDDCDPLPPDEDCRYTTS